MNIVYQTARINTPAIVNTEGLALASFPDRRGWSIQNVGQNPVFVRLGGTASSTVYHRVLKGGSADSDGNGGVFEQTTGVVFTGDIYIAGTTPKVVVTAL